MKRHHYQYACSVFLANAFVHSYITKTKLLISTTLQAARAYHNGNVTGACNEVALHFFQAPTASWLRVAAPNHTSTARVGGQVDAIMLEDTYDFYGERTQMTVPFLRLPLARMLHHSTY